MMGRGESVLLKGRFGSKALCARHTQHTEQSFQPGVREPMKVKLLFESHCDDHIGHNATLLFTEHHQPSSSLCQDG